MSDMLLLHHCCGPCSPRIIEALKDGFSLEGFWFNPNIHPAEEHGKRLGSLKKLLAAVGLPLHDGGPFSPELWEEKAGTLSGDARCAECYRVRMKRAAETAAGLKIKNFSTTLLASPYQKHELVKAAGEEAARAAGVNFVYRDLRPQYYKGKDEARKLGLYFQKYCGCRFSLLERTGK